MANLPIKELNARERMHHIIDIVDEDKLEAMRTLFHNLEEETEFLEYPDDLKVQLDKDFEAYKAGEKTYSKLEVEAHTNELLKSLGISK